MSRKLMAKLLAALPFVYGAGMQYAQAEDLEVVVVTAQKRAQSIQNVPISVTALSAKYLEDYGIQNWDDVSIPGVYIGTGARNESLFVRGVGSGTNWGFEQSVPVYIDGAYYGRARAENMGFMDLQRIEVLKGPQPTYFGQNAIAGALNITTARPTKELTGYLDAAYEVNAREKILAGAVSGPLSENFRARGAFKSRDSEGWMTNLSTNERVPQHKDLSVRVSAEWDITRDLKAYAKIENSDEKQKGRNRQLINCGVTNRAPGFPGGPLASYIGNDDCTFDKNMSSSLSQAAHPGIPLEGNSGYLSKLKYDGVLLGLDLDVGGYKLSSITSSYKLDFRIPQNDTDGGPKEVGAISSTDVSKQVSQEFRMLSPQGKALEWLAGVYFDHTDLDTSGNGDLYVFGAGTALGPQMAPMLSQTAKQTSSSWSIFGEVGYKITDPLTLKLGGRYSEVKKSATLALISQRISSAGVVVPVAFAPGPPGAPALFPAFTDSESRKDTSFQPVLTAEYRFAADTLSYASWKKGFKAGGFDHDALTRPSSGSLSFAPEKVQSYEAGLKTKILNGKGTLNVSVFRSDYDDLQASIFTGSIGFYTANAAKSRTQGLEIDSAAAVSNNLTLRGALTLLDAKYGSFPGASCNAILTLATPAGATCTQDLSGKTLQFSPKWSGNVGATLKFPVAASLKGSAQVDAYLTDDYNTSNGQDPNTVQKGYTKIDVRFALQPASGSWEVALVGRNITNKYTTHWVEAGVFGPFAQGVAYQSFLDRPRQIELQAKYNF